MPFSRFSWKIFVTSITDTLRFRAAESGWSLSIEKLLTRSDQFAGVEIIRSKDISSKNGTSYITTTNSKTRL